MKTLIIMRHGHSPFNDSLSEDGKKEIQDVSKQLGSILRSGTLVILSSPDKRAVETAEILASSVSVQFEQSDLLESDWDPDWEKKNANILALVDAHRDSDVVVLVAHDDHGRNFYPYVCQLELGMEEFMGGAMINGQAYILDYEQKTTRAVWPAS